MDKRLRDRFGILGSSFGLIQASPRVAAEGYQDWQEPIGAKHGFKLAAEPLKGSIHHALNQLVPLTAPVRTRFLFIETSSIWSAFFDNGVMGTDAASAMSVLAKRLRLPAVRATCVPQTLPASPKLSSRGSYGAYIVELFDEHGETRRSVYCANDGGKWKFAQFGAPLPFEDVEKYKARRLRDRFTEADLRNFLKVAAFDAFTDEGFPREADAILLKKSGTFAIEVEVGVDQLSSVGGSA